MKQIFDYALQYLPIAIALIGEIAVVAKSLKTVKQAKETSEFKTVIRQNKELIAELRESKKANRLLLSKIDKIYRENTNDTTNKKI